MKRLSIQKSPFAKWPASGRKPKMKRFIGPAKLRHILLQYTRYKRGEAKADESSLRVLQFTKLFYSLGGDLKPM